MPREIAIGVQDFEKIRRNNNFYVDKTMFIKEWWENGDDVTLINRPRRFGKTLTMSMVDCFFSIEHKDSENMFEGLDIWKEEKYRLLKGTYPVISLSFAKIKDISFKSMYKSICLLIYNQIKKYNYLFEDARLSDDNRILFDKTKQDLLLAKNESTVNDSLNLMSELLSIYYGNKVIILLDEYDTPMQEAYLNGYWNEAVQFLRCLLNATFKTNPFLERAIITGITRISKESVFSDLNNLEVITTTTEKYETVFGFTEEEVFAAMDEFGVDTKKEMKRWYDGFTFGNVTDIYNPWSVINALDKKRYEPYWVNTSSNSLLNDIMKHGDADLKMMVETLMKGENINCYIDEDIVYSQLDSSKDAVWSLMLAAGYLKVEKLELVGRLNKRKYVLRLPNMEVESMMYDMIAGWFDSDRSNYNTFINALLSDNLRKMNTYMNRVATNMFSYFDTGNKPSKEIQPERFYHGFVLGLVVDLEDRYEIKSNRESGFGRYDVMLIPLDKRDKAFIFEFKVKDMDDDETTLEDTVKNALAQIDEKRYEQELIAIGIPMTNIRKYGFAFEGKKVLIG